MPRFTADDMHDLTGKVAIVTGGGRGIGLEMVHLLASHNAVVYIAARSEKAFTAASSALKSRLTAAQHASLHLHTLDLARSAAANASAHAFPGTHVDILICNAGISMDPGTALSEDGWELMFQTNHLGHFAFVVGLLPKLKAAGEEARVVILASDAATFVKAEDLDLESGALQRLPARPKKVGPAFKRYGASKLANVLFARELDRRLREQGVSNVRVNSCHPGMILSTGLGGNGAEMGIPNIVGRSLRALGRLGIGFTIREGALAPVFVATSPIVSDKDWHGLYFVPATSCFGRFRGVSVGEFPAPAKDDKLATRLWEVSEIAVRESEAAAAAAET